LNVRFGTVPRKIYELQTLPNNTIAVITEVSVEVIIEEMKILGERKEEVSEK
jgi:hypothetical protein